MTPGMAIALKTEFEAERTRLGLRSGVCGEDVVGSEGTGCNSGSGVPGMSLFDRDLDRDSLRDRGRNISLGF